LPDLAEVERTTRQADLGGVAAFQFLRVHRLLMPVASQPLDHAGDAGTAAPAAVDIESWYSQASSGDEKQVRGYAASSGIVEGTARVLRDVNEIGQIRDGEILVCPVTAPSWGPVFGKIKAAVSDIGGTMSHAAIVAREYGMPAVVGTGQATRRIRTGQRVRVDGDRGVVTILD
jgi:pyruvate, water dikinase